VIACSHRSTYVTAGHRWRRTDTGPLQRWMALLTRYRYLHGPGSLSSSQSPRHRIRLLRRTGSSGILACSGARHRQDSMWRGPLVTGPLVAGSWSLLVSCFCLSPIYPFQGSAARRACKKTVTRDHRRHASSRAPRRGPWPLQATHRAPFGFGARRAGSSGSIRPVVRRG